MFVGIVVVGLPYYMHRSLQRYYVLLFYSERSALNKSRTNPGIESNTIFSIHGRMYLVYAHVLYEEFECDKSLVFFFVCGGVDCREGQQWYADR